MKIAIPGLKTALPHWLWALLLCIALLNCSKLFTAGFQPDNPSDFRTIYVGQTMLAKGHNPYNDAALKQTWKQIVKAEKLRSETPPGFPETPLVYPPWALVLFMPFSLLFYKVAYWVWYAILPLLFLGIVYLVRNFSRYYFDSEFTILDLLLIALAFKSTIPAFLVGQPLYLCLFLGFLAWKVAGRSKIVSGILLGLASFKITLVLPFVAFFIYVRNWKTLLFAAITGIILTSVAFMLVPDLQVMLKAYQDTIETLQQQVFTVSSGEPTYFMLLLTEIGTILVYYIPELRIYLNVIYLLLIGGSLFWLKKRSETITYNEGYIFLLLSLLTLICTYHLLYDCLLLLPLLGYVLKQKYAVKIVAVIIGSVFFLPVNGLLQMLHLPATFNILYFTTPLALLALLGLLLFQPMAKPTKRSFE